MFDLHAVSIFATGTCEFSNRINWVSRIEEQRKIIKNNEEKNPKLLFIHVHVYA
jgi:hypothetical protein